MRYKLIFPAILISLITTVGCDDKIADALSVESMSLGGDGFHYSVPHGIGDKRENPTNGCPCITLALGWSSYVIKTNAIAHGVHSLYDAWAESQSSKENGSVRLIEIFEYEKQLVKKWEGNVK